MLVLQFLKSRWTIILQVSFNDLIEPNSPLRLIGKFKAAYSNLLEFSYYFLLSVNKCNMFVSIYLGDLSDLK